MDNQDDYSFVSSGFDMSSFSPDSEADDFEDSTTDDFTGFNSAEDTEYMNDASDGLNDNQEDYEDDEASLSNRKLAILAVVVGLIVISAICYVINMVAHRNKAEDTNIPNQQAQVEQQIYTEPAQQPEPVQPAVPPEQINQQSTPQAPAQPTTPSQSNEGLVGSIPNNMEIDGSIKNKEEWIEFSDTLNMQFESIADADFTVTNIQNFVKVTSSRGDKMLRSVVTGNITGLAGEYEAEMAYDIASKLQVGTVIKIKYRYTMSDENVTIGEILF